MKKQIDVFNKEKLKEYSESLSNEYEIKVIEEKIYDLIKGNNKEPLDMKITDDYLNKGIGLYVVLEKMRLFAYVVLI